MLQDVDPLAEARPPALATGAAGSPRTSSRGPSRSCPTSKGKAAEPAPPPAPPDEPREVPNSLRDEGLLPYGEAVIKDKFGDAPRRVVHAAFPFLFWRPLNPNLLSVLGAVVSVGARRRRSSPGTSGRGGWLMIAGGFFDLVDGVVARHNGIASTFGAFLDSTLDRLVDMAVLVGIDHVLRGATARRASRSSRASRWSSSVLVSYAKARAEVVMRRTSTAASSSAASAWASSPSAR